MGEHGGAIDVVVAVHGVGAVEDGDAEAGGGRRERGAACRRP